MSSNAKETEVECDSICDDQQLLVWLLSSIGAYEAASDKVITVIIDTIKLLQTDGFESPFTLFTIYKPNICEGIGIREEDFPLVRSYFDKVIEDKLQIKAPEWKLHRATSDGQTVPGFRYTESGIKDYACEEGETGTVHYDYGIEMKKWLRLPCQKVKQTAITENSLRNSSKERADSFESARFAAVL